MIIWNHASSKSEVDSRSLLLSDPRDHSFQSSNSAIIHHSSTFVNIQLILSRHNNLICLQVEEKEDISRVTSPAVSTVTTPTTDASPNGVTVLNNASYPYSNRNTPGISKQPHCSPVSVITSPPPLSAIKSESSA